MELLVNEIPKDIKIKTIKKVENGIHINLYLLEIVKDLILNYEKNNWYSIYISWNLDVIKEIYISEQDELFITKDGAIVKRKIMEDFEDTSKIYYEENYIPGVYIPYNQKSFIQVNINNIKDILFHLGFKIQGYINLGNYTEIEIYISPIIDDLQLIKTNLLPSIKSKAEEVDYGRGGYISGTGKTIKNQTLKNGVSIIAKEIINIFNENEKDDILISKDNLPKGIFDVEGNLYDMYCEDRYVGNDVPILLYSLYNNQLEPVLMYMFLIGTIGNYYNSEYEYKYYRVFKASEKNNIVVDNTNLFELIPGEVFYDYKIHTFYNIKLNTKYEVTEKYFDFMIKLIESEGKRLSYEEISNIEDISDGTFKGNLLKLLRRKNIIGEKVDFIDGKNKGYKLKYYN